MAMRDVWGLQARFAHRNGGKAFRLLSHPKFRAAYDFLALRAETGGADPELVEWWTRFQASSEDEQKKMVASLHKKFPQKRRRKRRLTVKKPANE